MPLLISLPDKVYDFISGEILLFDKPYGWTSFDLVSKVRNLLSKELKIKKIKVGHAGTLDPLATGLMILCTGKATKQVESLQSLDKEYIATLKIGATTPSFDLETPENLHFSIDHITKELIVETLRQFKGTIRQVPPVFSAVKIQGRRAYKHAREGKDPELLPRQVVIYEIEMISFEIPEIVLRIQCSKGTYIRALARDIGAVLETGAYLTALRRTRIGGYYLKNAHHFEEFKELLKIKV